MRKEILFSLPFLYLWEIMKPWKWICPIFHLSPILASWPAIFLLSPFDHAKHAKIQFAKNCTIFFSWQNPQYKEYFIVDFFLWWTRLNFSQVFNKRSDIVYKKNHRDQIKVVLDRMYKLYCRCSSCSNHGEFDRLDFSPKGLPGLCLATPWGILTSIFQYSGILSHLFKHRCSN